MLRGGLEAGPAVQPQPPACAGPTGHTEPRPASIPWPPAGGSRLSSQLLQLDAAAVWPAGAASAGAVATSVPAAEAATSAPPPNPAEQRAPSGRPPPQAFHTHVARGHQTAGSLGHAGSGGMQEVAPWPPAQQPQCLPASQLGQHSQAQGPALAARSSAGGTEPHAGHGGHAANRLHVADAAIAHVVTAGQPQHNGAAGLPEAALAAAGGALADTRSLPGAVGRPGASESLGAAAAAQPGLARGDVAGRLAGLASELARRGAAGPAGARRGSGQPVQAWQGNGGDRPSAVEERAAPSARTSVYPSVWAPEQRGQPAPQPPGEGDWRSGAAAPRHGADRSRAVPDPVAGARPAAAGPAASVVAALRCGGRQARGHGPPHPPAGAQALCFERSKGAPSWGAAPLAPSMRAWRKAVPRQSLSVDERCAAAST
jgi:hypothetical protein